MTILDAFRRHDDHDLPNLTSDDELLAWAEELRSSRPKRTRPLVAAPLARAQAR